MSLTASLAAVILVVALAEGAVVIENGFPIQWDEAPAQLSDMPVEEGTTVINPWDYRHRMGMYRILISSTDPFMGSMGPGTKQNPLWNLPMQLGWMLRSGRLADPTGSTTCGQKDVEPNCISTNSWWACVNYWLSVIPFLAAVQAGVVGDGQVQVQIQVPAAVAQDFCTSFSDCSTKHPDLMSKWEAFFQSLKTVSKSDIPDAEKKDQILELLWTAEDMSLATLKSGCSERQAAYSRPELYFSKSWLMSSDFVGAVRLHSSMENVEPFMSPLPSRVLLKEDSPPNIADLSKEENHSLYVFGWMGTINTLSGGTLTSMWRKAMCTQAAREKGRALMHDMVHNDKFAYSQMLSIITEMTKGC